MPRTFSAILIVLVTVSSGIAGGMSKRPALGVPTARPEVQPRSRVQFERNVGQASAGVDFVARGGGYAALLAPQQFVLSLAADLGPPRLPTKPGECSCSANREDTRSATIQIKLDGSNPSAHGEGVGHLPARTSYILGKDSSKWRSDVPAFERVLYRDVYQGIDIDYHGDQAGGLEYDFTVRPGADVEAIALRIAGASEAAIDPAGDLVLTTPVGVVRQRRPVVYQLDGTTRTTVAGGFARRLDGAIGFQLGAYDRSKTLVIDPLISYSTYLGGSAEDRTESVAIGPDGSIYVTGTTVSIDFPLVPASPGVPAGGYDMFVSKFSRDGASLDFSVIIGGSGEDVPAILRVDAAGAITVRGYTLSSDFPTVNAAQATYGGAEDVVLFKLNATGHTMLYSTYIGGSGFEDCFTGLDIDAAGNAYIGGCTSSADFPVKNAYQPTYMANGSPTGFFAKYSAQGQPIFASYFGGSSYSFIYGIVANPDGTLSIGGASGSSDLPVLNAIQPSLNGAYDAFAAKVKADGSALLFSTYYGGSGGESFNRIAGDGLGAIYATGLTTSTDFPTVRPFQDAYGGGTYDVIAVKISPDGASAVYASYLGGSADEQGFGISVDGVGAAHVAGYTASTDFPLVDPIQAVLMGSTDITLSTVTVDGRLEFSTLIGGSAADFTNDSTCDIDGNVFVSFYTASTDFPTVRPYQSVNAGGARDGGVLEISNRFALTWNPPAAEGQAPRGVTATLAEGGGGGGARAETPEQPHDLTGYNVYRSTSPNVQAVPGNLFAQLPPGQTTTGPTAPGGSFFVVTAVFGTAESGASNEASAGSGGAADLTTVKVKAKKITAKGTGFTPVVQVFLDGIPFVAPATVKKTTKVTQAGALLTGETLGQYLTAHSNHVIVSFRNANGGVVTYRQ